MFLILPSRRRRGLLTMGTASNTGGLRQHRTLSSRSVMQPALEQSCRDSSIDVSSNDHVRIRKRSVLSGLHFSADSTAGASAICCGTSTRGTETGLSLRRGFPRILTSQWAQSPVRCVGCDDIYRTLCRVIMRTAFSRSFSAPPSSSHGRPYTAPLQYALSSDRTRRAV